MFSHVQLELARQPDHPLGDRNHIYHLYLPLEGDGRIDVVQFRKHRAKCRVRRFRPGEKEARGQIVHGPGGRFLFSYSDTDAEGAEIGVRLGQERFVPGEYISIREDDGRTHTFQVISVRAE